MEVIIQYYNSKGYKRDIDDIIDVLCDGSKEQIEKVLKENKLTYSFDESGEYSIYNKDTYELVRGHGIFNPNCTKYFGKEYDWNDKIKR